MNRFLKDNIESVTGGLHITKGEYDVLADQVINRFKAMNLVNPEIYRVSKII